MRGLKSLQFSYLLSAHLWACKHLYETAPPNLSLATLTLATIVAGSLLASHGHKTIVGTAASQKDLSTLVTAVKAADLVDTLNGKGPFTVFAPVNEAFAKLPAGTVESLVQPENKAKLTKILTYHVVAGDVSSTALVKLIKKGHGQAHIKTVAGDSLVAFTKGSGVYLKDTSGNSIKITKTDIKCSNGVVHLLDGVLLPK